MALDLNAVRPRPDGKYSPELHRWLRRAGQTHRPPAGHHVARPARPDRGAVRSPPRPLDPHNDEAAFRPAGRPRVLPGRGERRTAHRLGKHRGWLGQLARAETGQAVEFHAGLRLLDYHLSVCGEDAHLALLSGQTLPMKEAA